MADEIPPPAGPPPAGSPASGPGAWLHVDDDGRATLFGGSSASSGRAHFPPAVLCPYTGADDIEIVALPRRGTLWAWTAVTSAPPGSAGPVPYGFGIDELDDVGLRLVTRLTVPDVDALAFGQPMRLVVDELPDGLAVWAFEPDDAA